MHKKIILEIIQLPLSLTMMHLTDIPVLHLSIYLHLTDTQKHEEAEEEEKQIDMNHSF